MTVSVRTILMMIIACIAACSFSSLYFSGTNNLNGNGSRLPPIFDFLRRVSGWARVCTLYTRSPPSKSPCGIRPRLHLFARSFLLPRVFKFLWNPVSCSLCRWERNFEMLNNYCARLKAKMFWAWVKKRWYWARGFRWFTVALRWIIVDDRIGKWIVTSRWSWDRVLEQLSITTLYFILRRSQFSFFGCRQRVGMGEESR